MQDNLKWVLFICLLLLYTIYTLYVYQISYHPISNEHASKGKQLWQAKNCNSCHQLYGLGGYLGPDLTHIYSRRNEAQIKAFLKVGSNVMPDFKLTDEEMEHIIAFLKQVDKSGNGNPAKMKINNDGSIN